MKTIYTNPFLIILFSSILFLSCSPNYNKTTGLQINKNSSKYKLDWAGVYTGVMPCNHCDGSEFTLTLLSNNKFELEISHINDNVKSVSHSGVFTWDVNGNKIYINNYDKTKDKFVFNVSKDKLVQVDRSGNTIPTEFPNDYELLKVKSIIVEKNWKLIELYKDSIEVSKLKSVPNISFKAAGLRVYGSSGCNTFAGTYEESEGNKIRFSKMATSLKYCVNMKIEEKFFKVFEDTKQFSLKNDTLIFRKSRTETIAKFVLLIK